jgi:hypothetical protein
MPAGLVFIRWVLRQEPLIAMAFRFRRSTRLGLLRFNYHRAASWLHHWHSGVASSRPVG